MPHLAPLEHVAFSQAYQEERKTLRPKYVLLPTNGTAGAARNNVEESLRAALAQAAQAAAFSEQELVPFVASATHLEIQRGLLDAGCDPAATICALRSLTSPPVGPQAATYVEQEPARQARLEALKVAVEHRLDDTRIWRYSVPGDVTMTDPDTDLRLGQNTAQAHLPHLPHQAQHRALYEELANHFYALFELRERQDALHQYEMNCRSASRAWWQTVLSVLGGAVAYALLQYLGFIR